MKNKQNLTDGMIDVGGDKYYIDLEALGKAVNLSDSTDALKITKETLTYDGDTIVSRTVENSPTLKEIDASKYEIVMRFIDILIDYSGMGGEPDDSNSFRADTFEDYPFAFKVAFNSLMAYGILTKI